MSNRLRELRLVAPIVIAVCTILLTAIYLETHLERLRARGYDRGEVWLLWSQFCILSTSAAGIWMAAMWSSLHGKKTLLRLVAAVFTIVCVAALGWQSYKSLGSWSHPRPYEVLGALLGGAIGFFVICVLPLLTMRWLRAWGIQHEEDVSACRSAGRYSLKGIFFFTTAVAVFLTVLIWVVEILRVGDRGKEFVYFSFNILPSMGGLMLLMAMSRMRIRWIWPTACMLGLCIAGAIAFGLSLNSDRQLGWQRTIEEIFLPTLIGFIYAACLTLLAALWLRSRGFLIRCGGSSGFGAIRDRTRPFPRRAVATALTCVLLVGLGFGGWKYYSHWVLMKSAIPAEPAVEDLPRLMRVALHGFPHYESAVMREKVQGRRKQASDAIVSLGDQAVPFLLERVSEATEDQDFNTLRTESRLLSEIGARHGFGKYEDFVLETITGNELAFSIYSDALVHLGAKAVPTMVELINANDERASQAASVLSRIGQPHAASAIPALKEACLVEFPTYNSGSVYRALVGLAGSDAVSTLLKVVKDKSKYSLEKRAKAASAIAELGTEEVVILQAIDNLLKEVTEKESESAGKNGVRNPEHDYLKALLVKNIAEYGTAAKPLAPRLIGILESSKLESSLRSSVVKLLGRLQVKEAVPILEQILQEEESFSTDHSDAVIALGEIGPPAKNAIDTIDKFVAATGGWVDPNRLIAAEVAKARILMTQRESHIRALLNDISQPKDTSGRGEAFQDDTSQKTAALCALIWLGAEDNEQVMKHQAETSFNSDWQRLLRHFRDDPILVSLPMSKPLEYVLFDRHNEPASFDSRWTRDGKVLSLLNSLEIGLQADDAATRLAAADLLAAMGSLSLPLATALHSCLEDEDPRVRLRSAIALLISGEKSEKVVETLQDTDDSDWEWAPELRELIEARIERHTNN